MNMDKIIKENQSGLNNNDTYKSEAKKVIIYFFLYIIFVLSLCDNWIIVKIFIRDIVSKNVTAGPFLNIFGVSIALHAFSRKVIKTIFNFPIIRYEKDINIFEDAVKNSRNNVFTKNLKETCQHTRREISLRQAHYRKFINHLVFFSFLSIPISLFFLLFFAFNADNSYNALLMLCLSLLSLMPLLCCAICAFVVGKNSIERVESWYNTTKRFYDLWIVS